MYYIRIFILAVLLLFSDLATLTAQTVNEIVQKHLKAIGGADKWRKVNSIKTTGTFIASDGAEVEFRTTKLNNYGIYIEYTYVVSQKTAYEALTNTIGWSYIPMSGLKVRSQMFPKEIVEKGQNTLDIQDPLLDYKAKGSKVLYAGKGDAKGATCYKLSIAYKDGTEEMLYIDSI